MPLETKETNVSRTMTKTTPKEGSRDVMEHSIRDDVGNTRSGKFGNASPLRPAGGAKLEHHSDTKKSMKPGGGGRFEKLEGHIEKEGYSKESAGAIAASIGRKKYGPTKMAQLSAAGRKRKGK